ncbi:hypothetical protein [Clostridium estertheticum]|uniref:hypothetical protein n=1 Tax=Clostridium estertheticum TaxID=238834 RepID=UPI00124CB174|nr:hypothetical protein [Clostridium estertheticum]MBZ9615314.1 hypothetical protein [Clostridium estertheticum subsp. laramiense]WAG75203.1 hypothetical protein LL032_07060 [Clostridium estertheticum]
MIIDEKIIEELREEYEGLNLTDSQIIIVKGIGLNKEQMSELMINLSKAAKDLCDAFRNVVDSIRPAFKEISILLSEINEAQEEFIAEPIKNKKGKKLKCWENKRFYQ